MTVRIPAPAATPQRFGLLDAAVVVDSTDPHIGFGIEWDTDACNGAYLSAWACRRPLGLAGFALNPTRGLTITLSDAPEGTYSVDWGDGAEETFAVDSVGSGTAQHTYGADGDYTVVISGPMGYRVSTDVSVVNGVPLALFSVDPSYAKTGNNGRNIATGEGFAVYAADTCKAVGRSGEDPVRKAERALTLGEGCAVESHMAPQVFAEAIDITATTGLTAVNPSDALAWLEQAVGAAYHGQAVIWAPRVLVPMLDGAAKPERVGSSLETLLGSRVAALSCGVEEESAGFYWMAVTGMVVVVRGPASTEGPTIDPLTNNTFTLAERQYAVGWECVAYKVRVRASSCCTTAQAGVPQTGEPPPSPPADEHQQIVTGTDEVQGPNGSWSNPFAVVLRGVSVTCTDGQITVNGTHLSAGEHVEFDADAGEAISPAPTITAATDDDRAVVAWVGVSL